MPIVGKYIHYKLFARHKYGHGIHSPFVYNLIKSVFNRPPIEQNTIENERQKLLQNNKTILINDLGAGSKKFKTNERKISNIAKISLKEKKYAQLIYALIEYFKPETIIELGTSFGITTAYMAKANPNAKIITYEGCNNICKIAGNTFENAQLNNITLLNYSFDKALDHIKQMNMKPDLVIIDGNHTYESTIKYFEFFLEYSHENSILLFDDIYWSKGMNKAWENIKSNPQSVLTIDLFSMGLVFLKESLTKKNYIIKY